MKLSVVVPCYNESKNIPLLVERFIAVSKLIPEFELILVNNASKDDSGEVLLRECAKPEHEFVRVVDESRPGYGQAICAGLRVATGDVLAWTHADLQTDPRDIVTAFEVWKSYDAPLGILVKGTRHGRKLVPTLFSWGMSVLASVVQRRILTEINAQPKLFSRMFWERIANNAPHDFSLDFFLLLKAKEHRLNIVTIPVSFVPRIHGESSWATHSNIKWKTIWRTVKYIFNV